MADSTCALFSIRGRYWRPWATGNVFITKGGASGSATSVDLENDMNLDVGNEWMVGVDVRMGRHRIRGAYEPLSWSGKNTLDRSVVFHGSTFPSGASVKSDLVLTLYEVGYQYALVDGCSDTIWTGVSGWVWTFDGKMKDSLVSESRSFTHIYPVLTVAGEHRFGNWKIAGGVNFGGVATDQYVADFEASAGVKLFGHLDLEAGYRYMRFDFHTSTNKAQMTFSGPFVGVAYEF